MNNILIIGSNGMLGKDITKYFLNCDEYNVYTINRHKDDKISEENSFICDISDNEILKDILLKVQPDIIINCAAIVNVDQCEEDKEFAFSVNSKVNEILALYNGNKTKLVYISTDSMFNGEKGDYSEIDDVEPLNYYAETKLKGEQLILKNNKEALIIRTNIYGFHSQGVQSSLCEWAIENLSKDISINGFDDVYFNPVYTKQLAQIIYELIQKDCKGIINVASNNYLSKYDFLVHLCDIFGFDRKLVKKDKIDNFKFKAKRPKNTTLNIKRLNSIGEYDVSIINGLNMLKSDYERSLR